MRTAARVPGTRPGRRGQNLLLCLAYLGSLAGLGLLVFNVVRYYRPVRGC